MIEMQGTYAKQGKEFRLSPMATLFALYVLRDALVRVHAESIRIEGINIVIDHIHQGMHVGAPLESFPEEHVIYRYLQQLLVDVSWQHQMIEQQKQLLTLDQMKAYLNQ